MSGVYVKGLEMPKEGTVIVIYKLNGKFYASVHGTELCPLIPVPDHGDLIDRDEAVRDLRMDYAYAAAKIVALQPTIIPAEDHIADVGKKDGA